MSNTLFKIAGLTLFIAVAIPYIYDRSQMYALLWTNRSSAIVELNNFTNSSVRFQGLLRNCEDAVLDETLGIAYLSCDPGRDRWNTVLGVLKDPDWRSGRIWTYKYADPSAKPKPLMISQYHDAKSRAATFHPLGVALYKEKSQLYVVDHADSVYGHPTIIILSLSKDGLSANHVKTLNHELMYTPNSVFPLGEDEILFTNDHGYSHEHNFALAKIETYLALPFGSLIHFNHKTGVARKLADLPFANGVAVLNSTHLAVASTLVPSVHVYSYTPGFASVVLEQKLRPSFSIDNLKLDSSGKLLMAGHPHSIACDLVAKSNMWYDLDGEDASLKSATERKRAPSWVSEWDGNGEGRLVNLYVSNDFGTSTTAVRDVERGVGLIVGLYEMGILIFQT